MFRLAVVAMCAMAMTAALAQAPAPDHTKPNDVARAYLDACERWDYAAGAKLLTNPADGYEAQKKVVEGDLPQIVKELLCLPALQGVQCSAGEASVKEGQCRVPVVVTYTLQETLVLDKQPDGTWKVNTRETILSTTGAPEPILVRNGEQEQQTDCQANLKQLELAILCYAQDHDDLLPDADRWCDQIKPYLPSATVLRCPAAADLECGYVFNKDLSGLSLDKIDRPAQTIILLETDQGKRNASAPLAGMIPAPRHKGGSNAAFVDGHVAKFGQ